MLLSVRRFRHNRTAKQPSLRNSPSKKAKISKATNRVPHYFWNIRKAFLLNCFLCENIVKIEQLSIKNSKSKEKKFPRRRIESPQPTPRLLKRRKSLSINPISFAKMSSQNRDLTQSSWRYWSLEEKENCNPISDSSPLEQADFITRQVNKTGLQMSNHFHINIANTPYSIPSSATKRKLKTNQQNFPLQHESLYQVAFAR